MAPRALLLLALAAAAAAVVEANSCRGCWGWTYGPCRHVADGSCMGYFPGTNICPPGTSACTGCSGCSHGTSGPCMHTAAGDNSCFAYIPGTTTCWPGTRRCATGEISDDDAGDRRLLDAGEAPPALEDPFDVAHTCEACFGETSGQCRHNTAGDDTCEPWDDERACPVGTSYCYNCRNCAAGTSGPCRHASQGDNTCFPYAFGTTCPVGTYSCATREAGGGVPPQDGEAPDTEYVPPTTPQECGGCLGGRGPCVHQNDFSCHDYITGTTICPAGTKACVLCSGCVGGTWGPCRHQNDGTCTDYHEGTTCPPGTSRCATAEIAVTTVDDEARRLEHINDLVFTCALCSAGVGPCIDDNDICHHYADAETHTCPSNTHACVECHNCVAGTSGPCQHANFGDNSCTGYASGTTCPVGFYQCQTGEGEIAPPDGEDVEVDDGPSGVCPNCWGGTDGPCRHNNDGSCMAKVEGVCPAGTTACPLCSGCTGGTEGPCKHDNDGTCGGYMSGTTCWPGMTRCSTGETVLDVDDDRRRLAVGGEVTVEAEYTCAGCAGETSGPCQHINDGTCLAFTDGGDCPAGTRHCAWCADCVGGTAGPCRHQNDGTCLPYGAGTTCPAGTIQCASEEAGGVDEGGEISFPPLASECFGCRGGTHGPCRHNNDGSCVAFADDNNNCPAGTTPCEACAFCVGGTGGPCRHLNDGSCVGFGSDGACPPGTSRCSEAEGVLSVQSLQESGNCGNCFGTSSGPCRHGDSDVCHDYYTGTTICPAGTAECVPCTACEGDTAGPCRHNNDGTCIAFEYGGVCPAGSTKCATGQPGGFPPSGPGGQCAGCWPGTAGPCQRADTVCDPYFPGSQSCPAGSNECAEAGSLPSEPLVVIDLGIDGDIDALDLDEEAFAQALCEAAGEGCDDDNVVVEHVGDKPASDRRARALSAAGVTVGAVVVVPAGSGHAASDVAAAIAAADADGSLSTSLNNAGIANSGTAANSVTTAQPSMRVPAAPTDAPLSGLAIGLIAAGAVAVVALVVGGVVISRRSGAGSASKKVAPAGGGAGNTVIDAATGAPAAGKE